MLKVFFVLSSFIICQVLSEIRLLYGLIGEGFISPFELDSLNEDLFGERWEEPGELTPSGMRQMYILGHRDQLSYGELLSKQYNPNEIKMRSAYYNDTFVQAQSYFSGLFPYLTGPNLSGYQRNVAYPPQGKLGYGNFDQELFGPAALPNNNNPANFEITSDVEFKFGFIYGTESYCKPIIKLNAENIKLNSTRAILSQIKDRFGSQLKEALRLPSLDSLNDFDLVYTIMEQFLQGFNVRKLHKRLTDVGIDLSELNRTAIQFMNYSDYEVYNNHPNEDDLKVNYVFSTYANEMQHFFDLKLDLDVKGLEYNKENLPPKITLNHVPKSVISSMLKALNIHLKTKIDYVKYASSLYFEFTRPDNLDNTKLGYNDYFVNIYLNDERLITVNYNTLREIFDDAWSERRVRWNCDLNPFETWGFQNAAITLGVLLGVVCVACLVLLCMICLGDNKNELQEEDKPKDTEKNEKNVA